MTVGANDAELPERESMEFDVVVVGAGFAAVLFAMTAAGLPLIVAAPLFGILLHLPGAAIPSLLVSLLSLKLYIPFHFDPHILIYHQYWQAWAYHVAFTNSSELFLGIMILYYGARHVERACGSRKYGVCTRYSR